MISASFGMVLRNIQHIRPALESTRLIILASICQALEMVTIPPASVWLAIYYSDILCLHEDFTDIIFTTILRLLRTIDIQSVRLCVPSNEGVLEVAHICT